MKMYCIFSKEALDAMGGVRGKMTAQAGHAFLHAYWDAEENFPAVARAYRDSLAKKITLVVPTDDHLRELQKSYRGVCGTSLVVDAGLTVFKGETTTCLGIGPLTGDKVGDDLRALKVLT
jgi:peptidyl-tRNA hydrolase